ncbi:MAG: aminotransferase class I/II-fold pyridoxal phosphate-dependent enzyme [Armatimonadetes bacterium]|nr:aminotransferase class I/II-fold pyridoxal phosphate-dependent enzyme [Armatimonadota bacterium]
MDMKGDGWGVETICQHIGEEYEFQGAVAPPIFQSSLFVYEDPEDFAVRQTAPRQHDYTRISNPTTEIAERKIAALERTEACRLFGSGMAAITAAVFSATKSGSHVVSTDAAYPPAKAFLREYLPRFGVETTFVDGRDVQAIADAVRPETAVIYMESPGSFLYRIQDIEAVCRVAKERGILTIFDNSTATPYFQRPAEFGVDIVVHSVTKYLAGHSDVVAGAACGNEELLNELRRNEGRILGATLDPFAAWLLIRSLRTFPLRMERHRDNAMKVAELLKDHANVGKVFYPGLPDHERYDLVQKQMSGPSGMVSFEPGFQDRERVFQFCRDLQLFQIGVSWGGHESLCAPLCLPESDNRWFVRFSVGLETADDLLADLDRALGRA